MTFAPRTPARVLVAALCAASLAACAGDPQAAGPLAPHTSAAKSSGSTSRTTLYAYSVTGHLSGLYFAGTTTAPKAEMPTGKPFPMPRFEGVDLTVGPELGAPGSCGTDPAQTAGDWNGNGGSFAGSWSGGNGMAKSLTYNFLGSRDGVQLQLSASDNTGGALQQTQADGSITLTYSNAALLSDTRATYYDGKYRCVSFVVTATPVR
jgi:hypothetical protein